MSLFVSEASSTPCFSVSIVDFEQVNACLVISTRVQNIYTYISDLILNIQ